MTVLKYTETMRSLLVFFRASLYFALIASIGICVFAEHRDADLVEVEEEEDGFSALKKRAIDSVVGLITQSSASTGRSLIPLGTDLFAALAGLTLFGAFKLGLLIVSSFYLLSSFFPGVLAFFGLSTPFFFRSLGEGISEFKNLDYEVVARSLQSLPDKSFDALSIKGIECRARAICEIGEFMGKKFPTVAGWIGKIGDNRFMMGDKYTTAMMKGIKSGDCATAFISCSNSPFKKFSTFTSFSYFS